ncbi:MAG: hypothetical protein WCG47_03955 [Dermatophilaceae bacterium]
MGGRLSDHGISQREAETAYRALGSSPSQHVALAVQCARGHHVAAIYRTPQGLVYASRPSARSHGDRDLPDAAHHGGRREAFWFDWLTPAAGLTMDDPLPAGCECGRRELSRSRLGEAMRDGGKRLVID